jgi:signal transduction histidine kinase
MSVSEWMSILSAAGHLALALLVLLRRTPSPMALPIALLALNQFGWNFAAFAYHHSGAIVWSYLDRGLSPLTAPLAFHVICAFVGKSRPLRYAIALGYLAFASLVFWMNKPIWDNLFLGAIVLIMAPALGLLAFHLQKSDDPAERARTRLILAAALIGATFGSSDLWNDKVSVPFPALGNLATLVSTALVAIVTLRFRLLEKELSLRVVLYAVALAALAVLFYVAVFEWLGTNSVVMLGMFTVVLLVGVGMRELRYGQALRNARSQELVTMGRFSRQLAHDLKNPLAALSGALQFLAKERAGGRSLSEHAHFLDLMVEQVTRMRGVVDDYERIARVEPVRLPTTVNDLVRRVLHLQPFAAREGIRVEARLAEGLPECDADGDLLATALENLLRNAFEAMPAGGTVTVRTDRATGLRGAVEISVEDEGVGMDARQQARAFDDFFTTKATGMGLGLAFVRRVAHAHGGEVSLSSRIGRGTLVRVTIPAKDA